MQAGSLAKISYTNDNADNLTGGAGSVEAGHGVTGVVNVHAMAFDSSEAAHHRGWG
jgi:hypothetical protein